MEEQKTEAQLKEEALAKKWRETPIEGQQEIFPEVPSAGREIVYDPAVHIEGYTTYYVYRAA